MERSVCRTVLSASASGSSRRPSAEVAFEWEQGSISMPSTVTPLMCKMQNWDLISGLGQKPENTLTKSPRLLCAASQPRQGRWQWPLTLSVTLEIWPELWTLSGSSKTIPDYLAQVTDTLAVLRIRPLEFQLIIVRLTEGRRGGGDRRGVWMQSADFISCSICASVICDDSKW